MTGRLWVQNIAISVLITLQSVLITLQSGICKFSEIAVLLVSSYSTVVFAKESSECQ